MTLLKMLKGLGLIVFFTSCATIDRFFSNDPKIVVNAVTGLPEPMPEPELETYSANSQLVPSVDRNYKRMTKTKMMEDSDLQAGAGSLWVMEGQKSYLFAQNKKRQEGDPTAIKVEGSAMKQVQLKVNTIQDLLSELEEQRRVAEEEQKKQEAEKVRLAEIETETQKLLDAENPPEETVAREQATKAVDARKPASTASSSKPAPVKEAKVDLKEIEMIPSKIIEKVDGGMYRVSGVQMLTIKNRPYKVIATGLIKSDDFDDLQVSSNKLVEPQFDIVHVKKDDRADLKATTKLE